MFSGRWPDTTYLDSRTFQPMCFELNTDDFYCNLKNDDKGAGEVKIVISDDAPKGYDW